LWPDAANPYDPPVFKPSLPPLIPGLTMAACLLTASGCDIRDEKARPVVREMLVGSTAGVQGHQSLEHGIEYVSGYEAGLKRATAEQKPLLLVFRAGWCRFSAEMTQRTLLDPQVVGLSRRSVCVMIDADRDADTCRHFGVKAFPTLIVVPPDGGERFRTTGRPTAATLAAALEKALEQPHIAHTGSAVAR
jgi:thiol:disulfide interchange protein